MSTHHARYNTTHGVGGVFFVEGHEGGLVKNEIVVRYWIYTAIQMLTVLELKR